MKFEDIKKLNTLEALEQLHGEKSVFDVLYNNSVEYILMLRKGRCKRHKRYGNKKYIKISKSSWKKIPSNWKKYRYAEGTHKK